MSSSDPDADLVQRARTATDGDMRAFDQLVRRHESGVRLNCRYLTRSPDHEEDLAQEVFVKAFFGLKSFEGRSTFKSWVQRIKVNHCLNFLRKHKKEDHVDVQDDAFQTDPALHVASKAEHRLEAIDRQKLIRATLEDMPENLRIALVLRDMDELSYQEVADHLGVGLSAAKMRIKRAREDFRRRYSELELAPLESDASEAIAGG